MSMGYIPKKKLQTKRQRKIRKKYKNFSCQSCEKRCIIPTSPQSMIVPKMENCPKWQRKKL